MQQLETDERKKEEATTCINFLQHHLNDPQLSKDEQLKRGKDPVTLAAQNLAMQLNTREYEFMQAIKHNDITKMQNLLEQKIDINAEINGLRPINFAIINSQEDALRYLLALQDVKVHVTKDDVQQAVIEIEMLQAGFSETETPPDLKYTSVANTPKAQADKHNTLLRKAIKIYELVKQRYENDTKELYLAVHARLKERS